MYREGLIVWCRQQDVGAIDIYGFWNGSQVDEEGREGQRQGGCKGITPRQVVDRQGPGFWGGNGRNPGLW